MDPVEAAVRRAEVRTLSPLANGLEDIVDIAGRLAAWATLAQVVLVAVNVVLRYLFRIGPVSLQELEWHLMSPIALIGMSYGLSKGDHVRVDLIYGRFGERTRAAIDLLAAVLCAGIALAIMLLSLNFVQASYAIAETSPDPGGLPLRWLLKAMIPLGFLLLLVQALAEIVRALVRLSGVRNG